MGFRVTVEELNIKTLLLANILPLDLSGLLGKKKKIQIPMIIYVILSTFKGKNFYLSAQYSLENHVGFFWSWRNDSVEALAEDPGSLPSTHMTVYSHQ